MKAVVLRATGGPEALQLADVPVPQVGDGHSLVRVRAAGVNFADVLVRQGRYPEQPELPTVLGSEVAGEVDGRRVVGLPRHGGGGYAEYVAVPDEWLLPLPDSASFAEGAAFPLTFLTAWIPLTRQARVRPGTTVLVLAAAGGVGSAAVQVARALGARVVAAAGAEDKLDLPRELGAEEAYTYDGLADVRADVVVDPVGGEHFAGVLRLVRPLGVVLALGSAAGPWPGLDPALLVGRNVGVQGFYLGRLMRLDPGVVRAAFEELLPLWERGALRPVVGTELPLARAGEAHALIEQRRHRGKVVLVP
ncbi:MAG: zinc-binding dehydrogenase [Thermoleophilia bacterium]|nr:zinc-binding dehydrogenase [Thermoleophilia bacterium]